MVPALAFRVSQYPRKELGRGDFTGVLLTEGRQGRTTCHILKRVLEERSIGHLLNVPFVPT